MLHFDHCIIICNPASTHAERSLQYIEQIKQTYPAAEVSVVTTVPGGVHANKEILTPYKSKLGNRTLIGVVAGDGTINMVASLLLAPELPGVARQSTILPLWGGNANDLARMLNGRAPRSVVPLLRRGGRTAVLPLVCRMERSGHYEERLAICYASFGASAAVAERLGRVIRRGHSWHRFPGARLLREVGSTTLGLHAAPFFHVEQDGQEKRVFEVACFKGSRFAKVGGMPLRLEDERFYATIVRHKRLPALLWEAMRLLNPHNARIFTRTELSFTTLEATHGQFDGETVAIAAHTTLTIDLDRRPILLLSDRKARN